MATIILTPADPGALPDPDESQTIVLTPVVGGVVDTGASQPQSQYLSQLGDVNVSGVVDGSFLRYNASTGDWEDTTTISLPGSVENLSNIPERSIVGRLSTGVGVSENLTLPQIAQALISTDAENRLATGTDGKLFTPDLAVDPVAYYILAKA